MLKGLPLISHAIRKAKAANVFDEIWKQQKAEIKTRYVSSARLFAEMEQAVVESEPEEDQTDNKQSETLPNEPQAQNRQKRQWGVRQPVV